MSRQEAEVIQIMTINLQMIGRFGNQMFQYAHARALAERDGLELRTPRWVGERVFDINPTPEPNYSGEYLHGYFQNQHSAIYTKSQVKNWFKFRPWVESKLKHLTPAPETIVGHIRRGDMAGYGYPVLKMDSYFDACILHGLDYRHLCYVLEEAPTHVDGIEPELSWLPDFYIMAKATTLLRANSTFSWWAAAIGNARVFSPDIRGLTGGVEHNVKFFEGNHPRIADLEGIGDIYLKP